MMLNHCAIFFSLILLPPFEVKIFPSALSCSSPQSVFSPYVGDQLSYPHKTTCNINLTFIGSCFSDSWRI